MIPLYEMLSDLITLVQDNVSDFAKDKDHVREYNNEFEDDGEWSPALPCCLIKVTGSTPIQIASDMSVIDERGNWTMYAAHTCPEGKGNRALKLVDAIREGINGADFSYSDKGYTGYADGGVAMIGKEKSLKVYTISGSVIP